MKKSASKCCWNFLCVFWSFTLCILVGKMCSTYEIKVPDDYLALSGDLEVHVIGLIRTSFENVRLELLEIDHGVQREDKNLWKREVSTTGHELDLETQGKSSTMRWPPSSASPPLLKPFDSSSVKISENDSVRNESINGNGTNESFKDGEDISFEFLASVLETEENQIQNPNAEKRWTVLETVKLPEIVEGNLNIVKVQFPCGTIAKGGRFGVRLIGHNETINSLINKPRSQKFHKLCNSRTEQIGKNCTIVGLDVRWPHSILSLSPHHVETYPNETVTALLQFLPTKCSPAKSVTVPELWLDLVFCGHSLFGCTGKNSTHHQVVYSEQIRGYPEEKSISLQCELFGSAGYFALALRSSIPTTSIIETDNKNAYLKAVWSEHYVFNVHARSIFPCDVHGGGVAVLFQYPKCVLKGDRIRLFSRLRADVSSMIPPTTLHYVTEQRVVKGKHSLKFDCDFFSEKFIEYCFVYVSQAITGAVSDVRMDCVPTMPTYDSDSGNWGSWNTWSPCTTTCGGGTRNRFRYCDSPPPKYGSKFCEGPSVETERCGNTDWDCEFFQNILVGSRGAGDMGREVLVNRPEILAEIGPGCRCGCVVHLGAEKPRRLLATSSQSCPGRIFWQIEADGEHIIKFSVDYFRFPCGSQWLKVRDGDSRSSNLIGEISGSQTISVPVVSSGSKLLIEFFSDELITGGQECWGGFLAHAQQSRNPFSNSTIVGSRFSFSNILKSMEIAPTASSSFFLIHSFIVLFLGLIILISACLGIQYVFRYRKYQLASAAEDAESIAGDSRSSLIAPRNRADSDSTLLSEVISLRRFNPVKKFRHTRMKKKDVEIEEERLSESSESQILEGVKTPTQSLKTLKAEGHDGSTNSSPKQQRKAYYSSRRSSTYEEISNNLGSNNLSNKHKAISHSKLSEECGGSISSLEGINVKHKFQIRKIIERRRGSLSTSSTKSESTLGNDLNSSATSLSTRNSKAKKERKNLKKMLAESEFNLSEDGDLELDYYDYNVQNASAVPESYIGMDPAYLVWIPPFSPVDWDNEEEEKGAQKQEEDCEKDGRNTNIDVDGKTAVAEENRWKTVGATNNRCLYQLSNLSNEKETRADRSPSENSDYYRVIVDIRYADDDDDGFKTENSNCASPLIQKKLEKNLNNNNKSGCKN